VGDDEKEKEDFELEDDSFKRTTDDTKTEKRESPENKEGKPTQEP